MFHTMFHTLLDIIMTAVSYFKCPPPPQCPNNESNDQKDFWAIMRAREIECEEFRQRFRDMIIMPEKDDGYFDDGLWGVAYEGYEGEWPHYEQLEVFIPSWGDRPVGIDQEPWQSQFDDGFVDGDYEVDPEVIPEVDDEDDGWLSNEELSALLNEDRMADEQDEEDDQ